MARPKTYDDALRLQLIEAAAALLAREGPHALSTRRVAKEVGTSTTAIYSLLGSKEELLRAMYLEGFERLAEALARVPRTDDALADLAALGRAYFQNAIANPNLYRVMFGNPVAEFCPSAEDAAFARSTLQLLIDAVQRAIDEGLLGGDATELGVELWALTHGVADLAINGMLGSLGDAEQHLAALSTAMIDGLSRRATSAG